MAKEKGVSLTTPPSLRVVLWTLLIVFGGIGLYNMNSFGLKTWMAKYFKPPAPAALFPILVGAAAFQVHMMHILS